MSSQAQRVAARHIEVKRRKTAGEVRFIKDRGGDKNEWGWGSPGPSEREIVGDFEFQPKNLKPLASTLRSALSALGFAQSAYNQFTKIKSARISPDGNLGGKGYIQKIADMRRQMMNVSEALSSFTDTLYDEINAPHWNPAVEEQSPREREEVVNIMEDVDEIRDNPEEWAEGEEAEMDEEGGEKQSSRLKQASVRSDIIDRMMVKLDKWKLNSPFLDSGESGRYRYILFSKPAVLDGEIKVFGPKFIQVKYQTGIRDLPRGDSRVFSSERDALKFIEQAFVKFDADAALAVPARSRSAAARVTERYLRRSTP